MSHSREMFLAWLKRYSRHKYRSIFETVILKLLFSEVRKLIVHSLSVLNT